MRRGAVSLLVFGAFGTIASSAWGQDPAPAQSAAPPASAPTPAASPPTPVPTTPTAAPAAPATAADQPAPETTYELAARISFSLPTGDINGVLLGAMPLQIDAGRRFGRQLLLGVYGYAAVVFPIIGTAYALGFGAEGQYFLSQRIFGLDPWLGAQAGYLLGSISVDGASAGFSGPEGGVQAGLDYKKGFGPFAAFSVGSYSGAGGNGSSSSSSSGSSGGGSSGGGSSGGGGSGGSLIGEWITIGMRGTYDW
jgi:uncharacterized membrane protein YgcG